MKSVSFKKIIATLTYPVVLVLALFLIFEEWLWEKTLVITRRIGNLPVVKQGEEFLRKLPPYAALAALCLPWFLLLPVKLVAVKLVAHNRPIAGLFVLGAAKVIGTAILARIFALTRNEALKVTWFHRFYELVLFLLSWSKQWVKNSKAYLLIRNQINHIKTFFKDRKPGFLSRNFRAQLKLRKKDFKKKQ